MQPAAAIRIVTCSHPGEVEVAVLHDRDLIDYALWRPGAPDGVGDLHLGQVRTLVPAMAGAFVQLAGLDGAADGLPPDGFLPDRAGAAGLTVGDTVTVRVTRAAQGGKGARLALASASLPPAVGASPRRLARGPNPIERLAARYPGAPIILDTPGLATDLAALRPRLAIDRVGFDPALREAVDALAEASVTLPEGPILHFHPTPALVAIDVDMAAAAGSNQANAPAHRAANRAVLPALARHIRLRNFGGAILVDLAGMRQKARAGLGPALAAALAADPVPTRLLGFTVLGLAEIVRTRIAPPLHELRAGPLAAGLAALRASEAAGARVLHAAPAVAAALQDDAVALADLAQRTGRPLMLRNDPMLSPLAWRIDTAP